MQPGNVGLEPHVFSQYPVQVSLYRFRSKANALISSGVICTGRCVFGIWPAGWQLRFLMFAHYPKSEDVATTP